MTNQYSNFRIKDHFTMVYGYTLPRYEAFSAGKQLPAYPNKLQSSPQTIRVVADIDGDGFDDIVIDSGDVKLEKPLILFSNGDGTFTDQYTINTSITTRTNREVKVADLNRDGLKDLVFFPAPHGWKESELGAEWDSTEGMIVLYNLGNRSFSLDSYIYNAQDLYFHSGEIADINYDGLLDIIPMAEYNESRLTLGGGARLPYIQQKNGEFILGSQLLPPNIHEYAIANIAIGDINGDKLNDYFLAIYDPSSGYNRIYRTPEDIPPLLAYALGEENVPVIDLDWKFGGTHWFSQAEIDALYGLGADYINPHSQLVNIVDLNSDGIMELITSELVYTRPTLGNTGGVIGVYQYSNSSLINVTDTFFPFQPQKNNFNLNDGWFMDYVLTDITGDGKKDLITMSTPDSSDTYNKLIYINEDGVFKQTLRDNMLLSNTDKFPIRLMAGNFNGDGAPDIVGMINPVGINSNGEWYSNETIIVTLMNKILPPKLPPTSYVATNNDDLLESFRSPFGYFAGGSDRVTGSPDILQTSFYWGVRRDYAISKVNDTVTVDGSLQNEGVDILRSIERVTFADSSVALDIEGNAGTAAKILGALWGKESVENPAFVGIVLHYLDSGVSYEALLDLALGAILGANKTNEAIVELVFTNLIGEAPTQDVKTELASYMDSGAYSQAGFARAIADLELNATNINLVGLSDTGLQYTEYVP